MVDTARVWGEGAAVPLVKIDGHYYTPGGCDAWKGRTFTGAALDNLCRIAYIYFRRSGWYQSSKVDLDEIRQAFDRAEDPGCWWNARRASGYHALWKPLDARLYAARTKDWIWNVETMLWEPGDPRTFDEWIAGCQIPDADR